MGAILAHFNLSYREVMYEIPWAVVSRLMADQPNYEPAESEDEKDRKLRDRINAIKR